jgi:O-antigen/teichoic acid export membrane protein
MMKHHPKVVSLIRFMKQAMSFAPNIFWSNLNQILSTVSNVALSIIFIRFAGKELYGQYLFIQAILSLFIIVSIPGAMTVTFRTIAQGYDGVYKRATRFMFFRSMFGIPLVALLGLYFYLFKTEILGITLIACAIFFPFDTGLRSWIVFLKARSKFKELTICNSIMTLVRMMVLTAAILFSRNIIVIMVSYFLVECSFNIFYYFRTLSSLRNDDIDLGWKRQSYALTIMDLSAVIFDKADVALVGFFLTMEQVAIYGLVMKFVGLFFSVIRNTNEVILPKIYKSEKITIGYFYKFFLLFFIVPVLSYPLLKYPVLLLYGRDCWDVVVLSRVYIAILPFYFLTSITNSFMVKYQLNKEINFSRIISIVAVISLYAVLIPLYGLWGGVISSMLFFVIQSLVNLLLLKINKSKYRSSIQLNERTVCVEGSCCK